MQTALSFIALALMIAVFWYLIRSFFSKDALLKKRRRRRAGMFFVALLLVGYAGSRLDNDAARQAGFESAQDQRDAKDAGVSDAAIWRAQKAEVEEREATEAARTKSVAEAEAEQKRATEAEQTKAQEQAAIEEARRTEEVKKAKEAECLKDATCLFEAQQINISVQCRLAIEALAKWDFEWTDGLTSRKFNPAGWHSKEKGQIMVIGDQLKLQNGFGAWKHVSYMCAYDPATERAVDATVF